MNSRALRAFRKITMGATVLVLSGCATIQAGPGDPADPWEPTNRIFYAFNDTLDKALLEPVANLYLKLPHVLRNSIHNFFGNAAYPGTVINQLLQGKVERAMQDAVRFVFNTTFGIGGLFDVATSFGLPRHQEDFGQTLAVWGAGEGRYIHYPLLGSSTVRDTPGMVVGALTDAITYMSVALPLTLLEVVDARASVAAAARLRDQSALDPYIFTREAYRQYRTFHIHDGSPPIDDFDDFDDFEDDD